MRATDRSVGSKFLPSSLRQLPDGQRSPRRRHVSLEYNTTSRSRWPKILRVDKVIDGIRKANDRTMYNSRERLMDKLVRSSSFPAGNQNLSHKTILRTWPRLYNGTNSVSRKHRETSSEDSPHPALSTPSNAKQSIPPASRHCPQELAFVCSSQCRRLVFRNVLGKG